MGFCSWIGMLCLIPIFAIADAIVEAHQAEENRKSETRSGIGSSPASPTSGIKSNPRSKTESSLRSGEMEKVSSLSDRKIVNAVNQLIAELW
jgi:hypothetical protein